ncbi:MULTISPECIES: cyanophycin synthetase [Legionella]|uniref:Cyanophycin synthetase n=1 Tax=Legionella septentrionalis TaxID=2498109 RepID=A0A3S0WZS0_9GAMM|nr:MULTISPECIES: cyanophycin synthetase [Legionella]MCP0914542.1 cyanophycin synthetase [Legionella sp. 27cVA30]RUQ84985.1 cyanophycin synthetase [Legionella septentrionalis]RUR10323.1 cyanophycin synthetase [Legionella septentrionalis]
MEILNVKVLKGPNYWSNSRQNLIEIKLDLKAYEDRPTNTLDGFTNALIRLMPSLHTHHCSYGHEGGFIERLKEGTWLGHVVEHIALELQTLAGMECNFGRTRQKTGSRGVYHVVFSYEIENAGLYAATAAVNLVNHLLRCNSYSQLQEDIEVLKKIHRDDGFGISTKAIVNEAQKRDIPYMRLDNDSLVLLGQGYKQKLLCATLSAHTSSIGVDIAADKALTKQMLAAAMVPVPVGEVVNNPEQLNAAMQKLGFPLVIKPIDGNHGRGVTTNICTQEKALHAFQLAQNISSQVVVERYVEGDDYRFLVINFKLVAVARRISPRVIGNGCSTIAELVEEINQDPQRGEDHGNFLTKIKLDDLALACLKEQQLTPDMVLPQGRIIYLKYTANLSSGGSAIDVTDRVHPKNKFLAERVARILNLDVCGLDVIATTVEEPLANSNGAIIEVNAAPGLRMHLLPSAGQARNVATHIVDMLYPHQSSARIPIVAVTGTNGKTTTVRLVAHLARQAGYIVGHTTTEGIYINHELLYKGDCSGPISAKTILRDPMIDFAVFECARGGILRSGLGFDKCNISIILNIAEDHLGMEGIDTLEELARVKSVVAYSTMKDGYAILNADDDWVYALKKELRCHTALFSMHANNSRIAEHCKQGGLAAVVENDCIILVKGDIKTTFVKISDIPLTYAGTATCMVQNILAAILAGIISGFTPEEIVSWLQYFPASSTSLPGRMNLFEFNKFKVLVDYAHNKAAYLELKKFVERVKCRKKIGIIGSPGDRRPEDIRNIGFYAAQMYDEIIIRLDKDGRGKTADAITHYLQEGIREFNPCIPVLVIADELTALQHAIAQADSDCFIVICPENVFATLDYLQAIERAGQAKELNYEL